MGKGADTARVSLGLRGGGAASDEIKDLTRRLAGIILKSGDSPVVGREAGSIC